MPTNLGSFTRCSGQKRNVPVSEVIWDLVEGQQPIAATAIHVGHELREDVELNSALTSA